MKLVFFGTPDFAVPALQSLTNSPHQILSVVTNPDKKSGRGLKINYSPVKQACCKLGHEVIQPDNLIDKDFLNHLKQINPEIYVVVAFKILPEILLNIPPYGAINLHASLLPKYRGAAPINHAILNGEKETGLTTFQLKKKADTGNILQQKSIPIPSSATTGDIYCQLADLGGEILIKTLDGIENGSLLSRPQDEKLATAAPKISSNDILIALDIEGFEVSTGSACSSGKIEPSRTLGAMGLSDSILKSAVRVSLGPYNTYEEAKIFAKAVSKIKKRFLHT